MDCHGGVMNIKEHAVKVTVPSGAIANDESVQFRIAASLFGPFILPEGYHPISAFVWIEACYKFKKNIKIEIEHHAYLNCQGDISKLCLVRTCEHEHTCDGHRKNQQIMHEVTEGFKYEINSSFCTYYADHFCSVCLATKSKETINRIIAYHYLPCNFASADSFKAEVCFCYDLEACRKQTMKRFHERNMYFCWLL